MDTLEDMIRDTNRPKIAIMGGSYNPITSVHIQIARYVHEQVDINEIWLMPCEKHLQKDGLEKFEHRYKMCQIAAEPYNTFIKVSDFETVNKDGGSYSLLSRLTREFNVEFSYIIGMDQANNFYTWKNYQLLERKVRFIVVPRLGVVPNPERTWYLNESHIYLKNFPAVDTSATKVRELLKQPTSKQGELKQLLDKNVFAYICDEELYAR